MVLTDNERAIWSLAFLAASFIETWQHHLALAIVGFATSVFFARGLSK